MSAVTPDHTPIDLAELRSRKAEELGAMLRDKRRQYHDARFALRAGQMQKSHLARQLRKDMARVATVLTSIKRASKAGQA